MEREKHRPSVSQYLSAICFFSLVVGSVALLSNSNSKPLLKFCFNSRDQFVAAQCVLCDFYRFSATVLGCNGKTSALMSNITSTEAVCIISNCLQQVRQAQPQFSGRRRREAADIGEVDLASDIKQLDQEEPEFLDERAELTIASPSMKDFLNRYTFMDGEAAKELEEMVVDTIQVNVEEGDPDYE